MTWTANCCCSNGFFKSLLLLLFQHQNKLAKLANLFLIVAITFHCNFLILKLFLNASNAIKCLKCFKTLAMRFNCYEMFSDSLIVVWCCQDCQDNLPAARRVDDFLINLFFRILRLDRSTKVFSFTYYILFVAWVLLLARGWRVFWFLKGINFGDCKKKNDKL